MVDILASVGEMINTITIFGVNASLIGYVILSFIGGWIFSEEKSDKVIGIVTLLSMGAFMIFIDLSDKIILIIILIITIILGFVRILREMK